MGFDRDYARRKVALPTYPFQRRRYWTEVEDGPRLRVANGAPDAHPLLGRRLDLPDTRELRFEARLSRTTPAYLADHRLFGQALLPASAWLEMALAAAHWQEPLAVEDVVFRQALRLPDAQPQTVHTVLTVQPEQAGVRIFGRAEAATGSQWTLHATGTLTRRPEHEHPAAAVDLPALQASFPQAVPPQELYRQCRARGHEYGPGFQALTGLWRREHEGLGAVRLPAALAQEADRYRLHPVLLDAGLQVLLALLPAGEDTYLPLGLTRLTVYRRGGERLWSHARLAPAAPADRPGSLLSADLKLYDESGAEVAAVEGLTFKRVGRAALPSAGRTRPDFLPAIEWPPGILYGVPDYLPSADQLEARLEPLRSPDQRALLDRLEALSLVYILAALDRLGWRWEVGRRFTVAQLAETLGLSARYRRLLGRLVEILAEAGPLRRAGAAWEVVQVPAEETDPKVHWQALHASYPEAVAELTLLGRCGAVLAEVLRGERTALELLFPDRADDAALRLYQDSPTAAAANAGAAQALTAALAGLPPQRGVRLLELGAGTGGTTACLLPRLPADRTEYFFTDIGPAFTARARERFREYSFVEYQRLDIEQDPEAQGFGAHGCDIVIAANVLHATRDLRQALGHVLRLLAPGGLLILVEATARRRWIDLTFGLLDGWWRFADRRADYPLLDPSRWLELLAECGFTDAFDLFAGDCAGAALLPQAVLTARAPRAEAGAADWPAFLQQFPGAAPAFLSRCDSRPVDRVPEATGAAPGLRRRLEALPVPQRRERLTTHVREEVARVLGLAPGTLPAIERGFFDLGMDSLLAVELRNRLQTSLECPLPSTLGFTYPTIEALVDYLAGQLFEEAPSGTAAETAQDPTLAALLTEIDRLTEADVKNALLGHTHK